MRTCNTIAGRVYILLNKINDLSVLFKFFLEHKSIAMQNYKQKQTCSCLFILDLILISVFVR